MRKFFSLLGYAVLSAIVANSALAEDTELGEALSIELNAVETREGSCLLSFLVINGHPQPIEKAVFETVLFDTDGQVAQLTLFDYGQIPPARPRIRQFMVSGLACDAVGSVLINGVNTCDAPGLEPDACESGLVLSSRTDIEVMG
ncbi:MAG: hypothetical protein AAFQ32_15440 [Pseudomonadota bacterium]